MVQRLWKKKATLVYLPAVLIYDNERLDINNTLTIPVELTNMVNDALLWFQLEMAIIDFDPICKALGVCASDYSTILTSFASLLYMFA